MVLALVMIVKNEEHIIARNLESSLPLVDTYVIVDTGSSDRTMQVINELAEKHGKKGHLYEKPWINFGHNRTELLQLSRLHCDWALMMDADDFVVGKMPHFDDSIDAYKIPCLTGSNTKFYRPQLFNSKCNWKFVGSLHEYATGGRSIQNECLTINARCEGNRSKDPYKYLNDAKMLEAELLTNCDKDRTLFYLAQSYRDAGLKDKASHFYKLRATSGGWHDEQFISYLNLIRLTECDKEKLEFAWKGQKCNPKRKEIAYCVLQHIRKKSCWSEEVYALGYTYLDCQQSDFLFCEQNAYGWSYYDELGLHAYRTTI